ncbi:hypothetical protein DQ392_28780 [Streptomyces reniochalinae]|uniref:Uncharacterized protein n=2 Tax=Streptomyces reniochalinae TaxID=2250578 RepID=A0A367ECG8_9ACTN|nr:hypothetical protein DQ392_28780 [Streptomyces reniochalinae]
MGSLRRARLSTARPPRNAATSTLRDGEASAPRGGEAVAASAVTARRSRTLVPEGDLVALEADGSAVPPRGARRAVRLAARTGPAGATTAAGESFRTASADAPPGSAALPGAAP